MRFRNFHDMLNPIVLNLLCCISFVMLGLAACQQASKGSSSGTPCQIDTTGQRTLPITDEMIDFHPNAQAVEINDIPTILTYNDLQSSNTLQALNAIAGGSTIPSIRFAQEGKEALTQLTSFFFHNPDSIFVASPYYLGLVNAQGDVLFKQPINRESVKMDGIDFAEKLITSDADSPLYYNAAENCLYVGLRSAQYSIFQDGFYEGAIAAKIDLNEWRVEELPIFYPERLQKERFSTLKTPNITFLPDRIVYGFRYAANVYVYDLRSEQTQVFPCASGFTKNEAEPLVMATFDQNVLNKYNAVNPAFFRMTYDPYRQVWYRAHFSEKYGEENGIFGKNETFLSVWDDTFEPLTELKLPWNLNPMALFPTREGLLLYNLEKTDENVARYQLYRLDCK